MRRARKGGQKEEKVEGEKCTLVGEKSLRFNLGACRVSVSGTVYFVLSALVIYWFFMSLRQLRGIEFIQICHQQGVWLKGQLCNARLSVHDG